MFFVVEILLFGVVLMVCGVIDLSSMVVLVFGFVGFLGGGRDSLLSGIDIEWVIFFIFILFCYSYFLLLIYSNLEYKLNIG